MICSQQTPLSPAGLKYSEYCGFRFWIRPQQTSFGNLYAVCVSHLPNELHTTAFEVVGFVGDFDFDWSVPDHALTLALRCSSSTNSMRLFKDAASNYGHEWLICNADSLESARTCSDADFIRQRVLSTRVFRGFKGVYFASNGRGSVKIGKSDNCLMTRLRGLQIASPDELRVVAVVPTPNPSETEEALHKTHASLRIRGEWFAMTDDQAVTAAEAVGGNGFAGFFD
jgi:hypothetical protein